MNMMMDADGSRVGRSSASVANIAYRCLEPVPSPPWEVKGSSHRRDSTELRHSGCKNSNVGSAPLPVKNQKQPTHSTRKAMDSPREGPARGQLRNTSFSLVPWLLMPQARVSPFAASPVLMHNNNSKVSPVLGDASSCQNMFRNLGCRGNELDFLG